MKRYSGVLIYFFELIKFRISGIFLLILVFMGSALHAQKSINSTDQITIEGKVKNPYVFNFRSADNFKINDLGDVSTVNHMGQVLSVKRNVKGILLKDVIGKIKFMSEKPKDLFSYYFILSASDGYKVVLSWNEVFNGNNVYLVTDSDGKHLGQMDEHINILVLNAPGKGHIYIKGLNKLVVDAAL